MVAGIVDDVRDRLEHQLAGLVALALAVCTRRGGLRHDSANDDHRPAKGPSAPFAAAVRAYDDMLS